MNKYGGCVFVAMLLGALLLLAPNHILAGEKPLCIAIVSDINDAYGSTSYGREVSVAMRFIASLTPDLVLCAGDMVAGQSRKLSESTVKAMWQAFDKKIWQPLQQQQIAFAFTFGNHDGSSSGSFARDRQIADEFFASRRPAVQFVSDEFYPACYSFFLADVYFAVIDASSARIADAHKAWLSAQLATSAAQRARLRVVVGHLPIYAISQGRDKPGDVIAAADEFCQLLLDGKADYYISGHHHAYYLSKHENLKMLSCGALGGGPRRHLDSEAKPMKTMTIFHLAADATDFSIETYEVSDTLRLITKDELPPRIGKNFGF